MNKDTEKTKNADNMEAVGASGVTRITLRIKEEYRPAVELIAKHRQTSMNEAIEFCVVSAARNYMIDGRSIFSYIKPPLEEVMELRKAFYSGDRSNLAAFKKFQHEFNSLPVSLQTPKNVYIGECIMQHQAFHLNRVFNFNKLQTILNQFWQSGADIELIREAINVVILKRNKTLKDNWNSSDYIFEFNSNGRLVLNEKNPF